MLKHIKMNVKKNKTSLVVKTSLVAYGLFLAINCIGFIVIKIGGFGYQDYATFAIFIGPIPFCLLFFIITMLFRGDKIALLLPFLILLLKISLLIYCGYSVEVADMFTTLSRDFSSIFNVGQYMMQKMGIITISSEIVINVVVISLYQFFILYLARKITNKYFPLDERSLSK